MLKVLVKFKLRVVEVEDERLDMFFFWELDSNDVVELNNLFGLGVKDFVEFEFIVVDFEVLRVLKDGFVLGWFFLY